MTQDEIIEMAREAGFFIIANSPDLFPKLETFAKLVAKHTLLNIDPSSFMSYQEGVEAGRFAEREACAKVCEAHWEIDGTYTAKEFAAAIRARGQA